jgi:hypothetical protein
VGRQQAGAQTCEAPTETRSQLCDHGRAERMDRVKVRVVGWVGGEGREGRLPYTVFLQNRTKHSFIVLVRIDTIALCLLVTRIFAVCKSKNQKHKMEPHTHTQRMFPVSDGQGKVRQGRATHERNEGKR